MMAARQAVQMLGAEYIPLSDDRGQEYIVILQSCRSKTRTRHSAPDKLQSGWFLER